MKYNLSHYLLYVDAVVVLYTYMQVYVRVDPGRGEHWKGAGGECVPSRAKCGKL